MSNLPDMMTDEERLKMEFVCRVRYFLYKEGVKRHTPTSETIELRVAGLHIMEETPFATDKKGMIIWGEHPGDEAIYSDCLSPKQQYFDRVKISAAVDRLRALMVLDDLARL